MKSLHSVHSWASNGFAQPSPHDATPSGLYYIGGNTVSTFPPKIWQLNPHSTRIFSYAEIDIQAFLSSD